MHPPYLRPLLVAACLALCAAVSGCQTFADRTLPAIKPQPTGYRPAVEYTVGDFTFAMNDNDPQPSKLAGQLLGDDIMKAWIKRGYTREWTFVSSAEDFGGADYRLTITGSQHNQASFWAEVLNALTLTIFPYSVTQEYEINCLLEETQTGKRYTAAVKATDEAQIELFLLLTLPIFQRGHIDTMWRVADHLYDQLVQEGAFQGP